MAATTTTQRILLLRRRTHLTPNHTYLLHHFSSNTEPDSKPPSDAGSESQSEVKSSLSFISEVKSSLRREPRSNSSFPPRKPAGSSIVEITRNLSEFRRPTAAPPPKSVGGEDFVSAQELYNRNVLSNPRDPSTSSKPYFDSIRDSLRNLRNSAQKSGNEPGPIDRRSLNQFSVSLKQQGPDQNHGLGSGSIFGREGIDIGGEQKGKTLGFLRIYNYDELGQKLRTLRPGKTKGKWFTFGELKDRLEKLRDIEEKESQDRLKMGLEFSELRNGLAMIGSQEEEKKKKRILQPLNVMGLGHLGGVPSFMLSPPKDELVEKYFHPDNMSSAEKLKLELKKVRDEFKMSESDCGSARVQVAQLTTKIKHLSSALHKKDKHSRHGLQAMVQRRKKLLKYLRRTDWDSYCLVLSKLGLRDNTEIKA